MHRWHSLLCLHLCMWLLPERESEYAPSQTWQPPAVQRACARMRTCTQVCMIARWIRERDRLGRFIYGGLWLWVLSVQMGRERQRPREGEHVQRVGGEREAAFDNWLRDRHQNEIMLVNLSWINYLRSKPQYIHYCGKSIDPAEREKQSISYP